jgi:hypothetical protein
VKFRKRKEKEGMQTEGEENMYFSQSPEKWERLGILAKPRTTTITKKQTVDSSLTLLSTLPEPCSQGL